MQINFEGRNFDRLARNGRQGRELVLLTTAEVLRRIGKVLVPFKGRGPVADETPVGSTGRLRRSTVAQIVDIRGPNMRLEVRQGARRGDFFYGRVVRGGRRKGARMPPPRALEDWVRVKLGIPQAQVRSVAFLVARSISRKGIRPNPYHVRALARTRGRIAAIVKQGAVSITARLMDVRR